MNYEMRKELAPQEYIRKLFETTKGGRLSVDYYPYIGEEYTVTYEVDWTAEDAEKIVQKYTDLTDALIRIAKVYDESKDEADMKKVLSEKDFEIWNTYISPFEEDFETDSETITDISFRKDFGDEVTDEEIELIEKHRDWVVANARKRLPINRCCPSGLLVRARRYEKLVSINAPEIIVSEEGRALAEQMILYYQSVENPNV